ncbi:hypothetical protein [Sphingosinicella microcystinivorans]|uniref:Uncharacterized protein n=1 Tax=Sphingosinicella microcystinivorans TaxID=335406 RepID=A0ABX9SUH2_SPHMI|nr:hypothetical protein [Sphingosinicella microcystinivorans]RKS84947.1 hypothetical protein DFR51_3547 [Sphingosinicella microcystinivorans]
MPDSDMKNAREDEKCVGQRWKVSLVGGAGAERPRQADTNPGPRRTQLRKPRTEISTIVWVDIPCMLNVRAVRTDEYIDLFNI